MNASDMTLKMFLGQYNIGTVQEVPQETMMDFGHSEHTTAETEILLYANVQNDFDLSDTPSLAVNYLIKCGYSQVTVVHQPISPNTIGDLAARTGFEVEFEQIYKVLATDSELPPIVILVSFGKKIVSFTKVPGKQP